ncbi:MAG: hypothetical protein ABIH78_02055 [Candidatus Peregrinibacteria bacterium]
MKKEESIMSKNKAYVLESIYALSQHTNITASLGVVIAENLEDAFKKLPEKCADFTIDSTKQTIKSKKHSHFMSYRLREVEIYQ